MMKLLYTLLRKDITTIKKTSIYDKSFFVMILLMVQKSCLTSWSDYLRRVLYNQGGDHRISEPSTASFSDKTNWAINYIHLIYQLLKVYITPSLRACTLESCHIVIHRVTSGMEISKKPLGFSLPNWHLWELLPLDKSYLTAEMLRWLTSTVLIWYGVYRIHSPKTNSWRSLKLW